jgi:hypothetical protein
MVFYSSRPWLNLRIANSISMKSQEHSQAPAFKPLGSHANYFQSQVIPVA